MGRFSFFSGVSAPKTLNPKPQLISTYKAFGPHTCRKLAYSVLAFPHLLMGARQQPGKAAQSHYRLNISISTSICVGLSVSVSMSMRMSVSMTLILSMSSSSKITCLLANVPLCHPYDCSTFHGRLSSRCSLLKGKRRTDICRVRLNENRNPDLWFRV